MKYEEAPSLQSPWPILLSLAAALLALLAGMSSGCLTTSEGSVDLGKLAQQIELVRLDVADLAPLATPATQESLARLDKSVVKVTDALRAAAEGGPISSVTAAARAALAVADSVVLEMQASGQFVGDWPLYLGLAKIALRHLVAGAPEAASDALSPLPEQK